MVNVSGGSKACGNCKRRKLKCDECRPGCRRCEKAKMACDGYTPRPIKMYTPKTADMERRSSKSAIVPSPSHASQASSENTNNCVAEITDQIQLFPQKQAIHLCFLAAIIRREVLVNDVPGCWQSWVTAIATHERTGVVAQSASALAAIHFAGLYDCSTRDMTFARTQYSGAIQTLSKNLVDDQLSHDVGNTAAVLFLFWCEIATGPLNGHAYAQHNEGLARVVEHIGPHGHQGWLARKNLMMSRMNIIFFAMQQRRRTFLEHEDWKNIPWAKSWIPKAPMQRLLDIAANVPGLLQDADTAKRQKNARCNTSFPHQLLRGRLLSTLHALCQWRLEWHHLHSEAAFEVDTESHFHRTLLQIESSPLPTSLYFHSFARAHEMATYDAILLVLLDLAEKYIDRASVEECISTAREGADSTPDPLLLPDPRMTTRDVADEVHRMVNYFVRGEHRASGALAVYYALWACQVTLHYPGNNDGMVGNSLWDRLRILVQSR